MTYCVKAALIQHPSPLGSRLRPRPRLRRLWLANVRLTFLAKPPVHFPPIGNSIGNSSPSDSRLASGQQPAQPLSSLVVDFNCLSR